MVQAIGWALVLLILADTYLAVLYARAGTGLVSVRLQRGIWQLARWLSRVLPGERAALQSFVGPTLLVVTVAFWVIGLVLGFGLIVWPGLGTAIQSSDGPTPTDFATALYYSGYGLTTLGTGDIVPRTGFYRVLLVMQAALGFSVLTTTLTYFLSIYSALLRRNAFAVSLHHGTGSSGDAVDLLTRLGFGGDVGGAQREIAAIAGNMVNVLESHHFYPVLHYFRFREPYYALPRIAFTVMDTASLIKSAVDGSTYPSLVRSAAVAELWGGGLHLLDLVSSSFLPDGAPGRADQPEADEVEQWREHYQQAVTRLQEVGIAVVANREAGAEQYLVLRHAWNTSVRAIARQMAHRWGDVVPATTPADDHVAGHDAGRNSQEVAAWNQGASGTE